jgi:DNA-binding NarL/FixJ family response regulator
VITVHPMMDGAGTDAGRSGLFGASASCWPAWPVEHCQTDVDQFIADLDRVARGETAVDPIRVSDLLTAPMTNGRLARLTSREREVLALMAEGLTDRGIATRLTVTTRTAQAHAEAIFRKLDLPASPDDNRRVHAVLTYLKG